MARLRTLYVGTKTLGEAREEQHILILDGVTQEDLDHLPRHERAPGIPPILAFGFDVTGNDEDFKRMIRKLIRTGDPVVKKAVDKAAQETFDVHGPAHHGR